VIIKVVALVFTRITFGITEASTTHRPSGPCTGRHWSTTTSDQWMIMFIAHQRLESLPTLFNQLPQVERQVVVSLELTLVLWSINGANARAVNMKLTSYLQVR
jgi:hypothetical protein